MNKRFLQLKSNVGREVFTRFDKSITDSLFTKEKEQERISQAAKLAEQMPFVTMPLREKGILTGTNTAHILHLYQPNLWAQDFAHEVSQLNKMTIVTAIERSDASAEFKLETSKSLNEILRRQRKTVHDFLNAMREAALIESAYYTRISGAEMSEDDRKKIDTAIMRRAVKNEYLFKTILNQIGVDDSDFVALLQFSDEIDLTDCLKKVSECDPYFNRRKAQIESFTINSEYSASFGAIRTNAFVDELVTRLYKKHPAAFKKIAELLKTVS